MQCRKCHGLLVKQWLADELDEAYAWRCLNCGALTDALIERNRKECVTNAQAALTSS